MIHCVSLLHGGVGYDGGMSPPGTNPAPGPGTATEDARIVRTRRHLSAALVALALERPFGAITVRDLTDRAGIGYATFYRHYKTVEELLRGMLDELLLELVADLRPIAADPAAAGTLVFRHAREHADLYRVLLRTSRTVDILPTVVRVGVANVRQTYASRPGSTVPLDIAAHHLIRSFMDLIDWWLDHDMPYPPERMAEIYRDLIVRPTEQVALTLREGPDGYRDAPA